MSTMWAYMPTELLEMCKRQIDSELQKRRNFDFEKLRQEVLSNTPIPDVRYDGLKQEFIEDEQGNVIAQTRIMGGEVLDGYNIKQVSHTHVELHRDDQGNVIGQTVTNVCPTCNGRRMIIDPEGYGFKVSCPECTGSDVVNNHRHES